VVYKFSKNLEVTSKS